MSLAQDIPSMSISSVNTSQSDGELEGGMSAFALVLASVNLDALPALVTTIRKSKSDSASSAINCKVSSPPLFGSYNILFPIEFTDGVRWILKIPSTGYAAGFDGAAARALIAEAYTMRMLKRETMIPLPEVHAFQSSADNELNCPFILMDYIQGTSLSDLWFNQESTIPEDSIEEFRETVLMDLAAAMVQLNKFNFDKGGSPLFGADGNLTNTGPAKVADQATWFERLRTDDSNYSPAFYESGPWINPREFFIDMMKHRQPPADKWDRGTPKLLGLFIDWMLSSGNLAGQADYVLAHPDYDLQNILVTKEGRLCGLIDWDGVAAVPRCVGCERYPLWLTADWDPFRDRYDPDQPGCMAHSWADLLFYRSKYARCVEASLRHMTYDQLMDEKYQQTGPISTTNITKTTRLSLLAENLWIAATDPLKTLKILNKFFDNIAIATAETWAVTIPDDEYQDFLNVKLEELSSDDQLLENPCIEESEVGNSNLAFGAKETLAEWEEVNKGRATSSSNADDLLLSSNSLRDQVADSRSGWVQGILHYAIQLFHKKGPSQEKTTKNWLFMWAFPPSRWIWMSPDHPEEVRTEDEILAALGMQNDTDSMKDMVREALARHVPRQDEIAHENSTSDPASAEASAEEAPEPNREPSPEPAPTDSPEDLPNDTENKQTWAPEFTLGNISEALADDALSEAHLRRLKEGFDKVVASLLDD